MQPILRSLTVAVALLVPLFGCSGEPDKDVLPGETTAGPTFHKDVQPILQKHCNGCHAPGQIAPFSFTSFEDANAVASAIASRTEDRTMPPWGATETDECTPRFGWKDDNRLSDAEIATLKTWSEAGAPEGDPKDAPADVQPQRSTALKDVDLTIEPLKPFVASGDTDHFRCFVLDPKITEETYINGLNVVPGNPKVVHHVIALVDPLEQTVPLADADGGFDCFNWMGFTGAETLAFWAPGGQPHEYPENVGVRFPANSKVVMQVHYHPAGTTAEPDSTKVQLRFNKGVPEYRAIFLSFGNFPAQFPTGDGLQPGPNDKDGVAFFVPAGVKDHTETMTLALPSKYMEESLEGGVKLYTSMTHMHYVGNDMKISVERADPQNGEPKEECFVQTPRWDFNWQQTYDFDAALEDLPTMKTGDILKMRCTYNNTMDNPFLKKALLEEKHSAPKDVVLGEGTLDEMCVGLFRAIVKN